MKYSELISKRKQYKYSANICFDLENEERLASFIPNVTTTEILKEYLYDFIQNHDSVHSRILYGSYGTGKSHLLTVLSAILGHINTSGDAFETFLNAIHKYDNELAEFIRKYASEGKPYLVVPVYSDFSDFDKCISFSLKKELENRGYEICFKNYFYEALALIGKWDEGETSSQRLSAVCRELGIDIEALKKGLSNFEPASEKGFNKLFKTMTFGASFVSETGSLVDNIEQANEIIKDDFRGMVFVFDEFGRYIEDNGETIKVKVIQDFAEYCDHADYDTHLILVSHKQLSLYTDKMKKDLSDEWKKIEGRFKATSINVKYDQCLSLIPHIIPKTSAWDSFKHKYEKQLENLYEQAWDFKGFLLPPEGGNPFEGGFPLHPVTLYALDRLSKKTAQNERTFFTYLASDEENALFYQLEKLDTDSFHFIGLDNIYDYFEENIMSFRGNDIYLVYKKLQYAINKLADDDKNSVEFRILKVIAAINIIADTAVLAPNSATLCHVIDACDKDVLAAISSLAQKKIIKFMRQYGYYDFLDSSIYDLDSMIDEKIPSINDDMVPVVLNREFLNFAVYPFKYNMEFHMNRILAPLFAYRSDLSKKTFIKGLPDYYDGLVAFTLDSEFKTENYDESLLPDRSIILINTKPQEIVDEVKRYLAIEYFYSIREELKKDDPTVEQELLLYLEEEKAILSELIANWRNLNNSNIVAIMDGVERTVKSETELSDLASELMLAKFGKTIIVNNDLINKNNVSGVKNDRLKVLENIIEKDDIFDGITLLSPGYNIIRSVLIKNGIFVDGSNTVVNKLPGGTESGVDVMKEIRTYIKRAKKMPVPLNDLYSILKKPPYGLRDGFIPILLAYELKDYSNIALSFHRADRDYCAEELVKAFENPEDYTLFICDWKADQNAYIEALEKTFAGFLHGETRSRLKRLHEAMNSHFASVSKSARTTERYVSEATKQYRDLMSVTYKDYNAFFFEVLTQINEDIEELPFQIKKIKEELENVIVLQDQECEKAIRRVLSINEKERLGAWLKKRYSDSWEKKAQKIFDYQTSSFLDFTKSINQNLTDMEITRALANAITGFEIDYWNDSKLDDFEDSLSRIVSQIEGYEIKSGLDDNEIKIVIQTGGEEKRTTLFDKQELSTNGQMMLNKMKATINNFGQSLSQEEKMQIVTRLLEEIM